MKYWIEKLVYVQLRPNFCHECIMFRKSYTSIKLFNDIEIDGISIDVLEFCFFMKNENSVNFLIYKKLVEIIKLNYSCFIDYYCSSMYL